ncbi:Alpha/Beta hydrolase protein [Tricladium varicosporioides]|nr:Alpha/Beta hydrolase protein [Hymenoscyphus varicosporioides]
MAVFNFILVLVISVVDLAFAAPRSPSLSATTSTVSALPTIDLGYAIHRATINVKLEWQYYNFSNIRYASPPTGNLRFAASIPPTTINRTVNDGQQGKICAQAVPYWYQIMQYYLGGADAATLAYVASQVSAVQKALTIAGLAAPDPRTTEDCLFLDVITPVTILESKSVRKAPVLVWIYGGGYVGGDKSLSGNPATLISRSFENGGEGVVFVTFNYRLGLFVSLPNAGLYDQKLALQWVQKNIHLFGGDASRVTVIGESAGAGSIMHQITAYGGALGSAPFSRAILQSTGFSPVTGNAQQEATLNSVLTQAQTLIAANITSVDALRKLSFEDLAGLNTITVARSTYGQFTYGPVVDGTFVPKAPSVLLAEGKFDKSVQAMTAHNSNEGIVFTSPFLTTEADLATNLKLTFPAATNATIDYWLGTVYPPVYDGTYPYTSLTQRASLITAEVSFTCNSRYLDLAYNNETYSYYFTVPPGFHGEDIAYTFFNGDTTTLDDGYPVNATLAAALQRYITNFAMSKSGNPNGVGVPFFPKYQSNSTVLMLDDESIGNLVTDPVANSRCAWLATAPYA